MKRKTSEIWAFLDFLEGKIEPEEIEKRAKEYEKSKKETEKQLHIKLP